MPEKILVGVAWPYSNGSLPIGQIVGAYVLENAAVASHRRAHRVHNDCLSHIAISLQLQLSAKLADG